VGFVGNAVTRESVLQRSAQVQSGEPLDPIALANARYRISRLGVFDSVDLSYNPTDGAVRDPCFTLKESPRSEANLLFGYGSYEELRGGIELRQLNLFGLAHQSRIELVQSMKSTSGDYTYSVPELSENRSTALRGSLTAAKGGRVCAAGIWREFHPGSPHPVASRVGTAGYTFQVMRNKDDELATQATDKTQLNVASVDFGLTGDHRDNPLRPRNGYRWFTQSNSPPAVWAVKLNISGLNWAWRITRR